MAAGVTKTARPSRVPSSTLALRWQGGLNQSVDAGYIGDTDLTGGSNFRVSDGLIRLDQRYINYLERISGSDTPRGSGWGKYSTGSQSEQYLVVLNTTMYQVDLTTTPAVTAVGGATSLTASDWWFQQFQDYMYAGNATNGLGRKKLAAGSNGTGDWSLLALPTAPTSAPTATQVTPLFDVMDFSGGSKVDSGGSSVLGAGDVYFTSTSEGPKSVVVTLDTSPDLREDWSYRDTGMVYLDCVPNQRQTVNNFRITFLEGASEYEAVTWSEAASPLAIYYRLQNIARTNRNQITAVKFSWLAPSGNSYVRIIAPQAYGVWLSLDSSTNPGGSIYPTFNPLVYEYTYFNSTTGLESAPSPALTIPANAQLNFGEHRTLSAPTSGQSGVDFVRFYRVVTEGGTTTRYRIASVANTGHPTTVTTVDKFPLEEIKANTVYTPSVLPPSGITSLCAWQNRLVLAVGTLVYISRDGLPLVYEQQSGAYDIYNPARGRTFYPDDKRGEDIIAVIGQDDLYMVSKYSVRCLVGNSPDNWRLLRLPDSEGAVGSRAVAAYKKGIILLTPSGKLMYHHSSLLEPQEVSIKVRQRAGATNIAALATSDAVVTVWPDGDIMVSNSTGAYYILDTDGAWRSGTFTHGIHSSLPVPSLAKRWIGTNGKFYEGGQDSYVSDGGTTGTNGTAVTWYVDTRRHMFPRASLQNVFWGDSTESPSSGTPTYPILTPTIDGVAKTALVKRDSKRNKHIPLTYVGNSFKFRITGDKDTVIDRCELRMLPMSPAEQT